MAETKENAIHLGSLELILLAVVVIIILKMFVLTGCPCGCGALTANTCAARNVSNTSNAPGTSGASNTAANTPSEGMAANPKDKPTIYYHYTEWCGYCKKMKPMWASVKSQMQGRAFFIENDEDQNRTPNVSSYPTVIAHVDGQQITYNGGYTEAELMKFVKDAVDMKKKGQ